MSWEPSIASRVNQTSLLVIAGGQVLLEGGALPEVETRGHWHADVAAVVAAARQRLGFDVTVVRTLAVARDEETNIARSLVALAPRGLPPSPHQVGSGLEWRSAADAIDAVPDRHRAAVTSWLAPDSDGGPQPWFRAGWLDEAEAWARQRLDEAGRRMTGPALQVKHWSIAAILRIPTARGDAWFKAVPPLFAHEGALIGLLTAAGLPVPRTVAHDAGRGWTLMDAVPVRTLRQVPERKADALRLLATMHQRWAGHAARLFSIGCSDRRIESLHAELDAILRRPEAARGLTPGERATLRAFASTLPRRIAELRACGLPDTLMHGDFHPGNVAVDGDRMVIFDWTDGCVGHPLFDLSTFLPHDPVERAALLSVYFDAWKPAFDDATLDRAWELAEPLALVHHAVSYVRILDAVGAENAWEFDSDPLFWLRWLRDVAS